jgi:hypothetical protein
MRALSAILARTGVLVPLAALVLHGVVPHDAHAQSIAQRVAAAGRGTVELRYAARPGACGDGRTSFSFGRGTWVSENGFTMGRGDFPTCLPGPAIARLRLTDGVVTDVRVSVGPVRRLEAAGTDLGEVPSTAAAEYFLRLAETGSGRATHGAIRAAVLADSVSVWRRLLAISRDSATRPRSTRKAALFWVGRFAAAKIEGNAEDLAAADDDGDREDPRHAAIFALSQLKNDEGVPPLLQIARAHRDPALRRQALFWLGESGDPRGAALFEDLLRR